MITLNAFVSVSTCITSFNIIENAHVDMLMEKVYPHHIYAPGKSPYHAITLKRRNCENIHLKLHGFFAAFWCPASCRDIPRFSEILFVYNFDFFFLNFNIFKHGNSIDWKNEKEISTYVIFINLKPVSVHVFTFFWSTPLTSSCFFHVKQRINDRNH